MKIAIIGAGGVGGYLGAKLVKNGFTDVTIITRGKHLEAIKENGLTIQDEDKKFNIKTFHITDDFNQNAPYDLVIFTIKSYDFNETCEKIKDSITQKTILMTTANGVGYKEKFKTYFPKNPVCESCIYILSNIRKPGVIKKYGGVFQLFIGSDEVHPKTLEKIYHIFNNAGLKTKISKKITLKCWRKFLFISAFATMTSFYNASMGEIIKEHEEELKEVLQEIIALANKKGIELTEKNLQEAIFQAKNNVPFNATTSMLLDFRNKHKSEVDALTGYICIEGDKLGVKVERMKSLYKWLIIKDIENS
ncbi:ketopantoate reductase family protein [Sulfurospirillum arcachonense]|uniref:ketopantoate reductase family protein n=1 Tax=Sulfurospirillum arcachonense TaxID=57666 RepID=UPI000469C593|nr:2-dehydropantoate 2-reductase [Sulfurospirillum arcachonense]